tara:strand:- start:6036 stop:6905 length:870 start_codon:yes stop_codon:yes gene_type:complete
LKNLLGIGPAGCQIVQQLNKNKNYQVYQILPSPKRTTKYRFSLPLLQGPEEYEDMNMSDLNKWILKIERSCSVFLCGASSSTGITLRALETLHKKGVKMDIVYVCPEIEVLSESDRLHERSVRNIMQNFSRSGLFENICMVYNPSLEVAAGPTNVVEYYDQLNNILTSTYYMLDVFKNSKPIMSTFSPRKESCRISTIGIGSMNDEDVMFFPFDQEVSIVYYLGINEEKLKNEENLFRTITDKIKKRISKDVNVSFGIYPTKYEDDYIYVEYFSPKIQNLPVDTGNEIR